MEDMRSHSFTPGGWVEKDTLLSVPSTQGMDTGMKMVIEGKDYWIKRVVDGQVVEVWPDPEGAIGRQGNRRKLSTTAILIAFFLLIILVELLMNWNIPF